MPAAVYINESAGRHTINASPVTAAYKLRMLDVARGLFTTDGYRAIYFPAVCGDGGGGVRHGCLAEAWPHLRRVLGVGPAG